MARNKERERYYLLPGMGGRALRRKRKAMLIAGLIAGILTSAVVGGIIYLIGSGRLGGR